MNHDSVVRPHFDRAYIHALAASYEWTENALGWISPGFAAKVKRYHPDADDRKRLTADQQASIYVSEWVVSPTDLTVDGHWNGNRSSYPAAFFKYVAEWAVLAKDSVYVRTFKEKKVYAALAKDLYTDKAAQMPPFKTYPTTGRVLGMRTLNVHANSAITGTDSYFGTLVATNVGNGNYEYRDAAQFHRPRTDVPWLQLVFVPTTQNTIDLQYTLWNEWNTTNNDQVPIHGRKKTLSFRYNLDNATCSGDISGAWSASNPYTTKGNGLSGVAVKMYFYTRIASP